MELQFWFLRFGYSQRNSAREIDRSRFDIALYASARASPRATTVVDA
jgi:hypothetical protein